MNTRMVYVSDAAKSIHFKYTTAVLTRLSGGPRSDAHTSVSVGGKHVTVQNDNYFEYDIEFKALSFPVSGAADAPSLRSLWGFISYATRGGEFEMRMDEDIIWSTTLSAPVGVADTAASLSSTSGITAGEWFFLEDINDSSKWEKNRVDSVTATGIQLATVFVWNYATSSVIRYHEYFPACILVGDVKFEERPAGQGANLYDLRFKFRTVR